MKKLLIVLALLLALCCIFAACDNKAKNGNTQDGNTTQQGGNTEGGNTEGGNTESGTTPPAHTHAYTLQSTDAKFLANAATCQAAATYYYSCSCGEKDSATFEVGAPVDHAWESGVCAYCNKRMGEGLVFTSYGNGTCCVSSVGTCTDTNLVIPSTSPEGDVVIAIDSSAFKECSWLVSVTMPDSVIYINEEAFLYCSSLVQVTMSQNMRIIGTAAFSGCTSLISITIPSTVSDISAGAFFDCPKLIEVYNCSVTLPISIGGPAYGHVGAYAKNVYTPDRGASKLTTTDDGYVFYIDGDERYLMGKLDATTVKELVLPADCNGATYEIYDYAFHSCDAVLTVTIPDGVTSIGEHAFYGCELLARATIGNGVVSMGSLSFASCDSLVSITLGNSVTSIGSSAFRYSYKLLEIYNYSSLTLTKGADDYGYVAYYAKDIYTDTTSITKLAQYGEYIFYFDGNTYYLVGKWNGRQVETLTLPENYNGNTYAIYNYAFNSWYRLEQVTIPDSVTGICDGAFYYCRSLTAVTIPNSVTSIGRSAFSGCQSLASVTIGTRVESIGDFAFSGLPLREVIIPDSVVSIGENAFADCDVLASVTLGNGLVSIGEAAFSRCRSLTSIIIPDSTTSIGKYAFNTCVALKNVTIGSSLSRIGAYAFQNCDALSTVTFRNTSGWWGTRSSSATSGGKIDFSNPYNAATYLKKTYVNHYFNRT